MHPGIEAGGGLEPLGHGTLLEGSDTRRLDLLASLRDPLRRLLVRRYRQRASIRLHVLADLSASIGFRGRGDRIETLAHLVSALGYSAGRAGDAFAFIGCDEGVRDEFVLPPTRVTGAWIEIAARLEAFTPNGKGSEGLIEALPMIGGQRSMVFLASDFHFPLGLLGRTAHRALAATRLYRWCSPTARELEPAARYRVRTSRGRGIRRRAHAPDAPPLCGDASDWRSGGGEKRSSGVLRRTAWIRSSSWIGSMPNRVNDCFRR